MRAAPPQTRPREQNRLYAKEHGTTDDPGFHTPKPLGASWYGYTHVAFGRATFAPMSRALTSGGYQAGCGVSGLHRRGRSQLLSAGG
jgi:hypothetical protein